MKQTDRNKIFKALVGIYLFVLSGVMLWTVIRAMPDGSIIYVNRAMGTAEFVINVVCLSIGVLLGLGYVTYHLWKLSRRENA